MKYWLVQQASFGCKFSFGLLLLTLIPLTPSKCPIEAVVALSHLWVPTMLGMNVIALMMSMFAQTMPD